MFVNRVSELELLESRYQSDQAELFVLYGRRRIGKTELLAHFCEGKWNIFFCGRLGPGADSACQSVRSGQQRPLWAGTCQ